MSNIGVSLPVTIAGETREVEFIGHSKNSFVVSRHPVALAMSRYGEEAVYVFARPIDGGYLPSSYGAINGSPTALVGWAKPARAVA